MLQRRWQTASVPAPPATAATEQNEQSEPSAEAVLDQLSEDVTIDTLSLRLAAQELLHGTEEGRRKALNVLLSYGTLVERFLIAATRRDAIEVVELALEGLSLLDSSGLPGCIEQLRRSADPRRRLSALRAAQGLGSELARPFLIAAARDQDVAVRRRVVTYLSWTTSSWAIDLIRQLCNDPDPSVRKAAVAALDLCLESAGRSGVEQLLSILTALVETTSDEIRLAALRASQQLDDTQVRPFLVKLAHDSSPEVRRRVVSYLSWRNASWAMAELRILCNDEDTRVRWAAIEIFADRRPAEARALLDRVSPKEDTLYRQRVLSLLEDTLAASGCGTERADEASERGTECEENEASAEAANESGDETTDESGDERETDGGNGQDASRKNREERKRTAGKRGEARDGVNLSQ